MEIEKEPFVRYKLEEEKEQEEGEVFSVRLNKEEREWLNEIKEDLNIAQDGKALKTAAFIGKNVLQALFSKKILKYMFKNERKKLE